MIVIDEHPISQMYSRITVPTWEKLGHKINKFSAVTPKDLYKKRQLTFGAKKNRDFTGTEKAVWYSHFELWCECLKSKTPMIILEHDSKIIKPLPDLSKEGYKFLSFINRDFGQKGQHLAPGSGYYITPLVAQRLIAEAVCKPIAINSDGHLALNMNSRRQIKMNDFNYIEQINIDGLNTIDHKNPNRNYVGLDYEEIDISSIHGQEI
jgi:GR25 family glycosyltransferase involved in LPS biosynthesis